jgi:hypothetical protein
MARASSICLTLAALLAGLLVASSASAQVNAIGRYKEWRVYTEGSGRSLICFAATSADDAAPRTIDHGDVNFYVATWKSGSASNQPSLKVGYDLRTDLAPQAIVGRARFRMYASGPEAFFPDDQEKLLLAAVKKGSDLRIEAVSTKSTRTAYHFSLKGASEAMDKAKALCR